MVHDDQDIANMYIFNINIKSLMVTKKKDEEEMEGYESTRGEVIVNLILFP